MKFLAITALLAAAIAPSAAQSATGMAAMQYYVGSWSCTGASAGKAPSKATLTYSMDDNVLRMWVVVPKQGKMTKEYASQVATVYDAKAGQYVQTGLDTDASWSVTTAKPWSGNTEVWYDRETKDGKLGRGETIRTSQNSFSFKSYPSATSTKASFSGTCTRT